MSRLPKPVFSPASSHCLCQREHPGVSLAMLKSVHLLPPRAGWCWGGSRDWTLGAAPFLYHPPPSPAGESRVLPTGTSRNAACG